MCYGWKCHTFLKTSLVGTGALLFYKDPQPIDQLKNEKKKRSIKANDNIFLIISRLKLIHCFNKQAIFNEAVFNQKQFLYKKYHLNLKLMRN